MAKIIKEETIQAQSVSPVYSTWKISAIGASLGVLYWLLTLLIDNLIISPVFCQSVGNASVCINSVSVAGDITTILVAIIGVAVMIRFRIMQPLIVSAAAAATLWGLSGWTNGLVWAEIIVWSALLYALAYLLYSWIARYTRLMSVVIGIAVVVVVIRIALVL